MFQTMKNIRFVKGKWSLLLRNRIKIVLELETMEYLGKIKFIQPNSSCLSYCG